MREKLADEVYKNVNVKPIKWPGRLFGLGMMGFGIWKLLKAKFHIDEVIKQIDQAKNHLIFQTGGVHLHRPGDNLIKNAFAGLT